MQPGSIVYFGTNGPQLGHDADVIYGSFDSFEEQCTVAKKCDGLSENMDVVRVCIKANFFLYTGIDGTYFGCLRSPDDMRLGSKTVVFVFGRHVDVDEMIEIIKQHPYLRYRFMAVCHKYGWDNIFE